MPEGQLRIKAGRVEGWFHTGDMGAVDPDGSLLIYFRAKNFRDSMPATTVLRRLPL